MDQINEGFVEVPIESWLACVGFEPNHRDFLQMLLLTELPGHDFKSHAEPKLLHFHFLFSV